jgi:hypothetical protein
MTIQPEGEDLRKAVKWVSEERQSHPEARLMELVEKASLRFNLTPKDAEFLMRFVREEK